jgi:hypothetical protein
MAGQSYRYCVLHKQSMSPAAVTDSVVIKLEGCLCLVSRLKFAAMVQHPIN